MFSKKQVQRTSDLSFLQPILMKIDSIQAELRHSRSDLALILRAIDSMRVDINLEKQATEYLDRENETSHQTELEEQ